MFLKAQMATDTITQESIEQYESNLVQPDFSDISQGDKINQFDSLFGTPKIEKETVQQNDQLQQLEGVPQNSRIDSFQMTFGYLPEEYPSSAPAARTVSRNSKSSMEDNSGVFNFDAFQRTKRGVESSNNPTAKAPTSSALGIDQIINSTWDKYAKKYGYTREDRKDPVKSGQVSKDILNDYVTRATKDLGRTPTNREAYYYWFLGPSVAGNFLNANRNAPVSDVVGKRAINANKSIFYSRTGALRTVGEAMDVINSRWNKRQNG